MLRKNKGISLVTAIMTVVVMIILLSTISYSAINNVNVKRLNQLYSDLREVTDAVQIYYAKHDKLPVSDEKFVVTANKVEMYKGEEVKSYSSVSGAGLDFILSNNGSFSKENLYNPNDYDISGDDGKAVYYKVDLSVFDNITLTNTGTYLVNEKSKTVYYYDGVLVNKEMYYRLPLDYIDVPYDEKENASNVTIRNIYLPMARGEGVTLKLEDFLSFDKKPRQINFNINAETSDDYFIVDSTNGTITSVVPTENSLSISSSSVGKVDATVLGYGTSQTQTLQMEVYMTEVYLEDNNFVINNIEDELKTINIPVGSDSYKIIKANKNGAAGDFTFIVNNNCDKNNSTDVSYELLDATENSFGRLCQEIKIHPGNTPGKAMLTVIENNGNAYKNLNINIVKPKILSDNTNMDVQETLMENDISIDINYPISIFNNTITKNIKLGGLEDIDWTIPENSIVWTIEPVTEGEVIEGIVQITEENNQVTLKPGKVNGTVYLKCKIIIDGKTIKEIRQPVKIAIPV